MSLRIANNPEAFNAHRRLAASSADLTKSMEKLSSGFRINRAADDAAGLAISESMRGQIKGLGQAQRNTEDGIGLVQTAEANLDEVHSMLQRVRELAVQYKNGTLSAAAQSSIQTEVNALASEIERIGSSAEFNGKALLNGTGTISFQVGADDGEVITASTISLGSTVGAFNALSTSTAIQAIDDAIAAVSGARATFGAVQNRLEHTLAVQAAYQENLIAAESRIRDVDMAQEMAQLTKGQILTQAGTSMLSQANQSPQNVLKLLQ